MYLSPEQIKYLCVSLQKVFEQKTGNKLITTTSPIRYKDLSNGLDGLVKPEWLAKLFRASHHGTDFGNPSDYILDLCSKYIGYTDAIDFFGSMSRSNGYYGTYKVYWTDTVSIESNPEPTYRFDVTIGRTECVLIEHGVNVYTYKGGAPLQKKDTLYIDLSKDTEKVFFLLNIGAVDREDLEYIPGIFASGDRANIHPCSGPVMFVRSSIEKPDQQLLLEYFRTYSGNNLIKSRTISEVLELKRKIATGKTNIEDEKTGKVDINSKLKALRSQTFYLYYYRESNENAVRKTGVARAVLTFHSNEKSVELTTYAGTQYFGTVEFVSNHCMVLRLEPSTTRERSLSINLRVGSTISSKYKFMVGTYCNFSGRGAPNAGVVIAELTNDKTPKAVELFTDSVEYGQLNEHVKEFLKSKVNNDITTRSKGLFSDEDFIEFFAQQRGKVKINKSFKKIFIAYPMSSSVTDFGDLSPLMAELKKLIEERYKCNVFYAGQTAPMNKVFNQSYLAAKIDFYELEQSDLFILIHPRSIASSTLVEAGWAIGQGKTTLIFYKDRNDLPFILRDIKHVTNVNYFDFPSIEQLIDIVKEALDWLRA